MTTAGAPRASRDRRARQWSDHLLLPLASAPPRLVPECHDDVCITCSDEAVPVRVVTLLAGELATVDTGAGLEEVSVALVEAAVGDTVLVHAKEAIAVVRPERR